MAKWNDTSRFSHTFPIPMNFQDGFSKLLQDRGRVGMSLALRANLLDTAQVPVENCTPGVVGRRQCHILSIS